jgi:two-component system sensor histidine kinase/response regulator
MPESAPPQNEHALLERLSIATQAAGIYVWELDWKTYTIQFDQHRLPDAAGNRHYGQELGSDLFKYVHPEDQRCGSETILKALREGRHDASFRYRLRLADGSIRHIQAYARTTTDEEGKPVRSLGVSWDVTREVEAAEQLRRQAEELADVQRRLERTSLSIQEGHWEVDLITQRHWVSSGYRALLGYTEDELDVHTMDKAKEIIHPDDRERAYRISQLHIANGTPYEHEIRLKPKNGDYRWFRVRAISECDASGRPIRLSGSIHDIHQQKQTEDELKIARQRFERAIRGTQDGLWEWDFTTRTFWVSPRYESILRYPEGELTRHVQAPGSLIHPEDLEAYQAAERSHFEGHAPLDVEVRMRTRDGEYRWIRIRGEAERDDHGTPLRVSGSIQDVTDARTARDELIRATEAAQAANRSKSAFLANVSHEIRTPMNGIIGMTSLLLDTSLDRVQREYAESIRQSADSLLTIINDILDFSKIEAGKLDVEFIEMDLLGHVEDVGSIMSFQAAAKNLELIVNVKPDVPTRVKGDPQRIRQCLINLLGNAIKFTPAGEVVTEVSLVGKRDDRALIRFEVRDTGIGIAPQTVHTLFQPFVQADSSTTRHFGGTGLGLSIVRRLVEIMDGKVGVESELGKGSTFWFELPMEVVDTAPAEEPPAPARTGGRILVVDDNETNRRVLAAQLDRAGYRVSVASVGTEALALMRKAVNEKQPFDVVLADFQMPVMDGAMLGERINSDAELSNTRVVLLTSMDRHGDMRRFAAMGFAGYLPKPVRARELIDCLQKVMAHDAHEWHAQTHPMVTRAAGGRQPCQSEGRAEIPRAPRLRSRCRRERRAGGQGLRAEQLHARPHGLADAGDGRLHGHPPHPGPGRHPQAHTDRGAHRKRDDRTARALPGSGHGWSAHQTAGRGAAAGSATALRSWRESHRAGSRGG